MRLRFAVAGLLLGLIGLITVPFIATGNVSEHAPLPTGGTLHVSRCTDGTPSTPHFYFFDKGKESKGAFGPSADKGSDDAVKHELVRRLCGDKNTGQDFALLAVINRLYEAVAPNSEPPMSEPEDIATELVRAIDWGRSNVITTAVPSGAVTLLMSAGDVPTMTAPNVNVPRVLVTPLSQEHRHSRFLVLYFHGSNTPVLLRLPCGFQPIFADGKAASKVAD